MPLPGSHLFALMAAISVATVQAATGQTAPSAQAMPAGPTRDALGRIGADLFSATPHPAEAIRELKILLAAEPTVAQGHLLLGIAYRAQGTPELMGEAVAELRQALALNESLVLARLTLARVYLDMSPAARAREELQIALEQVPGNPQILALFGEAERQLGNPARSVELNQQALQADPTFVQARYYLGLARLDLKQRTEAIEDMQQVVASGARPAEAYLGLGTAYLDAGRVPEAIAALREAARLDPSQPEAHIQLSRAYRSKGLLNDAAKQLALALPAGAAGLPALYKNVESDFYMEDGLVRMQQGRLEAAAASFRKVLELDASHEPAKRQLAAVQKRLQDRARNQKPDSRL